MLAYYDTLTSANTMILNPKTLKFANTQQTCLVSAEAIEFHSSLSGAGILEWEGTTNSAFFIMGVGTGSSGMGGLYPDAPAATGNINFRTINVSPNDSVSFTLTVRKQSGAGFANTASWY